VNEIMSQRRSADIVRARQVACFVSTKLTFWSLAEVGRFFGGRDHTTILHSVRKITGKVKSDARLKDEIDVLKLRIQQVWANGGVAFASNDGAQHDPTVTGH